MTLTYLELVSLLSVMARKLYTACETEKPKFRRACFRLNAELRFRESQIR